MRIPNFDDLRSERAAGRATGSSFAEGVHPNPRFYKYYWWVFWNESPIDGQEFLTDKYRLNTATALALTADLKARGEPYWLYNRKLPRRDATNPFDPQSSKWRSAEWAVPYDNDPDPVATEPLNGHK